MFSKLAREVMKKNCSNFKVLYYQNRNLTWEASSNSYKKIGLEKDTISIYEGIRNIKFNKNKNVKKGEILFEVESDTNVNNKFIASNDCIVVEKNKEVMKNLNIDPENKEKSWILKISDIRSYGTFVCENPNSSRIEKRNAIKSFLDSTRIVPYNYYDNSLDEITLKQNKNISNSNEQDLIYYIQGNH